ncbi:MAG: oligosaccharide repeat unit polymerase [Erysipelotrichaceae bacterium]|nr:oligosaccharide repeat unit polymerase [Erysipelotrichaceae bacterium]
MEGIWSENKYINLCINVLLFLVGINFMHYGQLFLPIICFLLFIDNKLRFEVNNPKIFVILCLFAISFYAFSYQLGFYCVMGFTLPMAYYISSNMLGADEEKIKKVIYLFALAMGCHVILNSIFEYIVHGHHGFFMSTTHYDVWTRDKIANTATAVNGDLIIGCFYYLLFHEKNKRLKTICFIVLLWSIFYLIVIGRRTPIMMLGIVFVASFCFETFYLKNGSKKLHKSFSIIMASFIGLIVILALIYSFNLFNARQILGEYHIIQKFTKSFINDQRFELYFGSFKLMPQYLWGGQHISKILGEQVHDFWIDIYDYAGIVTCAIMIVYSVICLKNSIKLLKNVRSTNAFRILYLGVFISIALQLFFEPVMTGSSIFVIVAVIIVSFSEKLVVHEK